MRAVTPSTDLTLAMAEAKGTGATAIKIYADLPGDLVRRITGEAHRQHLLVWAHAAVFPASPREVVDAGVDVVSHSCLLAYQASSAMPPIRGKSSQISAPPFPKRRNLCCGPKQIRGRPWSCAICCPFVKDSGMPLPCISASFGL